LIPYELGFLESALKEWESLDNSIRNEFERKLLLRLKNPDIPSAALKGNLNSCYKIKSGHSGYRLTYLIEEESQLLVVIAIGKRERLAVYESTRLRFMKYFENKE
jgi:mRNA interferase RelE/StbE